MKRLKMWKKQIMALVLIVCTAGCIFASQMNGVKEVTDVAASRDEADDLGGVVYFDEEAVALAEAAADAGTNVNRTIAMAAFQGVNAQRAAAGLSQLAWSDSLEKAANVRMSEASTYFSHTRPNGSDWWTVDSTVMYGENLAKGYSSADTVVSAWMASPTHKANIMNGGYVTMAITVFQASNGVWFWAQEFGY